MGLTYKESGVNIEAGYESVKQLTKEVKKTFNPMVIDNFGSFGALFMPNWKDYKEPVLVSSTDGVGTKLLLAIELGIFETIGIDLVAMCVNDIIALGARPLFMLDYIALHKLEPKLVTAIIKGIVKGCQETDCALIGGETAEMKDVYRKGDFDLAGFVVGIVDKQKVINGKTIKEGDAILMFPSSGAHSNGYSLARKLAELAKTKKEQLALKKELLTPTRLYVRPVIELMKKYEIKGIANITGGGLYENVARILPAKLDAVFESGTWEIQPLFKKLQKLGKVADREMFNTFNMGMGMVFVTSQETAKKILKSEKNKVYQVGTIKKGNKQVIINGIKN